MNNLLKNKSATLVLLLILIVVVVIIFNNFNPSRQTISKGVAQKSTATENLNPLSIQAMREKDYLGSNLVIEQTLSNGVNYHQYIVSYLSEGLKIYGLLTVPVGDRPKDGWPVIIFNHGYITPASYETYPTIGQYATYYPVFSRAGYIVFKPDFRGNGNSEGQPEGAYYSSAYATDDLNAIASIKKYKDANLNKIGVWGHSMGGNITLRDLVVDPKDIKAAVIWGGVVGSYSDLLNWHDSSYHPSIYELSLRNRYRSDLINKYGTINSNSTFWNSIDPTNFVGDIQAPVQLHVGELDEEVPTAFSQELYDKLKAAGKTAEYYEYPGANHNISQGFNLAMQRSLSFFDKYLKGGE